MLLAMIGILIFLALRKPEAAANHRAQYQTPAPAPSAAPAITVDNGSMTQAAGQVPVAWSGDVWVGKGKAKAVRDTAEYHSAPAALRLSLEPPDSYAASATNIVGQSAGKRVRVSGYAFHKGNLSEAIVSVVSYDTGGKEIAFQTIVNVQKVTQWTPFGGDVTIPDGAAKSGVIISAKGAGSVYLDDLQAEESNP